MIDSTAIEVRSFQEVFPSDSLDAELSALQMVFVAIAADPLASVAQTQHWLTPAERQIPLLWRSAKRRSHWLAGRIAAKEAVRVAGHPLEPARDPVAYAASGAPTVEGGPTGPILVTLTHSGQWAMAVVVPGGRRLGIDYETGAHDKLQLLDKVCSRRELEANNLLPPLAAGAGERFAQIWTLKEACLKAFEVGLVGDLHSIVVSKIADGGRAELATRDGANPFRPHPLPPGTRAAVTAHAGHPLAFVACPTRGRNAQVA